MTIYGKQWFNKLQTRNLIDVNTYKATDQLVNQVAKGPEIHEAFIHSSNAPTVGFYACHNKDTEHEKHNGEHYLKWRIKYQR